MSGARVKLRAVAAFGRDRGADYDWSGEPVPAAVRERVPVFLADVARSGQDAVLVLDHGAREAWLVRVQRGAADEHGRPVHRARVDHAVGDVPFGAFELALSAYRRPREADLEVAPTTPQRPLSSILRARLAFGRPASVPIAEVVAASAFASRYQGVCLPLSRAFRRPPSADGLLVAGIEGPRDSLEPALEAIAPLLDDALAAAIAALPRLEADEILAWLASREGIFPSAADAAIDLWARSTAEVADLGARVARVRRELDARSWSSPSVRRYLFPSVDGRDLATAAEPLVAALGDGTVDALAMLALLPAVAAGSQVPRERAVASIAALVGRGAVAGSEALADRLVRALLPGDSEAAVDALVGFLTADQPAFVPPPSTLPVDDWRALLPVLDPVVVLDRFLAEIDEDAEREALCVAEIGRRQSMPIHHVTERRRRRHAATCAALARLPGWERHAPTAEDRREYVLAAADRVGLPRSSLSIQEVS